jgi:hypothetical protein
LAAADRRKFISLLESRRSKISSELIVSAHTAEPETLAQRVYARASVQKRQDGGEMAILALIGTLPGG